MDNTNGWHWQVPDVITQSEESRLAQAAWNGDYSAAAHLVYGNLRLVLFMAAAFARSGLDRDDLVGAGLHGAWVAALRYNPEHGVKFCTYATWWIRSFMVQHRRQSRRLLAEFPNTVHFKRELWRQLAMSGRGVSDTRTRQAMQSRLGITAARLDDLDEASRACATSMDTPAFHEGEETVGDCISSPTLNPEQECMERESRESAKLELRLAMDALTDREAAVMRSLLAAESLAEAGRKLGVTKQRAKQIGDRAASKMRHHIEQMRAERSSFYDQCA